MAYTRVRDVVQAHHAVKTVNWAANTDFDVRNGSAFIVNGTPTSAWNIRFTNVPASTDETFVTGNLFMMRFFIFYKNGSTTANVPNVNVVINGTTWTTTIPTRITTANANVYATYVLQYLGANTWAGHGHHFTSLAQAF
jgi:hypothetical protein